MTIKTSFGKLLSFEYTEASEEMLLPKGVQLFREESVEGCGHH
jgi:hypothetical protein